MDLDAVRTFAAVADAGQFSEAAAGYGLRRIPLRDPVPVYPHALLWRQDNPHPALAVLRGHLRRTLITMPNASTWTPAWA